jgi:hypothetical protein
MDGPGIEIRCGRNFQYPSKPALGPPSLLYNGYWSFTGGKAAWAWRWPSIPSSAEVKERAELYLYSPSGISWPVIRWTFTFTLLPQIYKRHHTNYPPFLSAFNKTWIFATDFQKYSVPCGRKPGNGTLKYTALRESLLKKQVNKWRCKQPNYFLKETPTWQAGYTENVHFSLNE